jgi:hypothetical protein
MLQVAEVIFNNTRSQINKDLTEFLKRNLKPIILRASVQFKFTIAHKDDLPAMRDNGIKRLPVMIINNKHYTSVPMIITELQKRVKHSKTVAAPKSEAEVLSDYFKHELGDIKTDRDGKIDTSKFADDDEEDMGSKLTEAAMKEVSRRNIKSDNTVYRQQPIKFEETRSNQYDAGPNRNTGNPRSTGRQSERNDNVQRDAGDPMRALNSMQSRGERSPDDDLVAALLDKIGAD